MKQIIRLTESDLHRLVKESVNKILKEVKYKGHSLHGDNPYDWATMHHVRDMEADKSDDLPTAVKHLNNSERNLKNAIDTDKNNSLPTAMSRGKNRAKAIVGEGVPDPSDFLDQEPGNASFGKHYDEDGNEYDPYEDDGEDYLGNPV